MKHNIGLTYEQLSDVIYYLDWKLMEIREAGCDLEYPDVVNTLNQLEDYKHQLAVSHQLYR
tara:strand:- start:176 stop:358 length:183 start_codon:yes stop_codon:yes gene_type:complete